MRSDRKKQIMTLSILLISIFVISIGFAAFSRTFQFEPTLTVNPDSRMFGVKFSKTSSGVTTGIVTPTPIPSQETQNLSKEIVADDITIDGTTTVSGLFATFISPGDSVEYSFYAVNAGEYDAYLNSINFIGNKTCTAGLGTTDSLVQAACAGISMEVTVDGITYKNPTALKGKILIKKAHQTITVKLSYDTNAARADGPFTVEFQDLSLYYSTVDGKLDEDSYVCQLSNDVNSNKQVDLGDEVTCGTETFYVLPNDSSAHPTATGDNITLLAKYNLNVGNDTVAGTPGIQNAAATGYLNDNYASCNFTEDEFFDYMNSTGGDYIGLYNKGYGCRGTMPFSRSVWWTPENENSFVYNDQSFLYTPVENYKAYLKGLGVDVKEASLGSYSQMMEAFTLSATQGLYANFNFTNFWLGSTSSIPNIYFVKANGTYSSDIFYFSYNFGVRPIIVISKTDIEVL